MLSLSKHFCLTIKYKQMKRIFLFFSLLLILQFASAGVGGYATMRVFDCNKAVGMGTGYIAAKIFIVYENGDSEELPLLPYSEKNEFDNLKKVNQTINSMKAKGYFLITQYTCGEQGNLVSDYTFLKQ